VDIGIGLPIQIAGLVGPRLLQWAKRADALGFSSLGAIDRLVYDCFEPLTALTAAAAVTERARLITNILIAPLRMNAALFAKECATLDRISGGRLVLGLAVGGRQDDFQAGGSDFHRRGRFFDQQLSLMKRVWNGETAIGPAPARPGGPPIIIGGHSPAALHRVPRYDGWIAGRGGPARFAAGAQAANVAWAAAGRAGKPRLLGLCYYALGENAGETALNALAQYYSWLATDSAALAAEALTSVDALREGLNAYEAAGCDELLLLPCSTGLDQVELLAEALFSH
jgi:alkanesulfonate monooxygenase SsuD/methylene tetrahydromethanopterin reductase-like flavin-dependent oxidoreductase (luciferase family)